jgi:hypothetical protein
MSSSMARGRTYLERLVNRDTGQVTTFNDERDEREVTA